MSEEPPIDRRNLSHVPSWIMVGFLLGVVAMLGFRGRDSEVEPVLEKAPEPTLEESIAEERNALAIEDQPSLNVVEALFEQYREYAFWANDRTEIAVWNTRTLAFSDFFEVLRTDTGTYFKTIPRLTRLVLEDYGPADSPIRFTETAAQRALRYQKALGLPPETTLRLVPSPPSEE